MIKSKHQKQCQVKTELVPLSRTRFWSAAPVTIDKVSISTENDEADPMFTRVKGSYVRPKARREP